MQPFRSQDVVPALRELPEDLRGLKLPKWDSQQRPQTLLHFGRDDPMTLEYRPQVPNPGKPVTQGRIVEATDRSLDPYARLQRGQRLRKWRGKTGRHNGADAHPSR